MTSAPGGVIHFIVPAGFDDPAKATGGNVFDRRVRDELMVIGCDVQTASVDPEVPADAEGALSALPDGALVLIDGLVAGRASHAIEAESSRLRVVLLAHMVSAAFEDSAAGWQQGEERALRSARLVIATSEWTRSELIARGVASPERIAVATPGSDVAPAAPGTAGGRSLLCVGVIAAHKGQDVLIEALAALDADATWTCTLAGSVDAQPDYAHRIQALAEDAGIDDRVTMTGALPAAELDQAYQRADLVVAPSRVESYGMAIADALRRGIPVLATSVGGIPQVVGSSGAAVLVPPDRPEALRDALRRWMSEPGLRDRLKTAARGARMHGPRWSDTAEVVARALAGVR